MPFGLVNAPATFCRLMRKLLHGINDVDNFIDDIILATDTWEKHIRVLTEVLTRLRNAGLTARPSKCFVGYDQLDCLGHVIGGQRLQPDLSKVEAVKNAPIPTTKKQVRSFLGLVGFMTNVMILTLQLSTFLFYVVTYHFHLLMVCMSPS